MVGTIHSPHFLESAYYIPERILKRFDELAEYLIENGLQQFYMSFGAFKQKLMQQEPEDGEIDNEHALTMEQLKTPLIIYACLLGISSIVFVIEIILHHCKKLIDRNK